MSNATNSTHTSRVGTRDDCWTESATETLIESWGDRYLQLNRGNLRQTDWKDVANAVNSLRDKSKPPRTDVQCKNRMDTLKKKYKAEKSKSILTPSKWPFYYRLDELIGSVDKKKLTILKSVKPNPNPNDGGDDDEEDQSVGRMESLVEVGEKTSACNELAKAIVRFGEVYERIENVKQEEMMEMEKKRMEFAKQVEFQRLNMFVETQLEIEKVKKMMKNKKQKKMMSTTGSLSTGKKTEL